MKRWHVGDGLEDVKGLRLDNTGALVDGGFSFIAQ